MRRECARSGTGSTRSTCACWLPPPRTAVTGVPAPFAEHVFAYSFADGHVERRTWPFGPLGHDVDLPPWVPENGRPPLIEWTGTRFVAILDEWEGALSVLPFDYGG